MNGNKEIYLSRPSAPPLEEFIEEIRPIWDNRMFTNVGEKHRQFEAALMAYLGCENLTLTSNGHMALELALSALDVRGEVITTPFTFASTIMAIIRMGLKPVFCDIDPHTLLMDPSCIERHLSEKTGAIMPVHLFGHVCDIDRIAEIAAGTGIKVIYDGAQSFASLYRGKSAACYGDACILSFHATKVFHSIEGGAVSFADAENKKRADVIRNFGLVGDSVEAVGFNAKLTEIAAAMGLCNLRHMDEALSQRRACCERYREKLENVPGVRLIAEQDYETVNYSYFPIVVEDAYGHSRDELESMLVQNGIHPRKYYVNPADKWDILRSEGNAASCPVAEDVAKRILILPLYQDLLFEDIDRICGLIARFSE